MTTNSTSLMEVPLYFGAGQQLFGMLHMPVHPARKALLLCPPLGQEQIRCHRLYRQLARALALEGIAVLRFDYYGTGDSAGASNEVDWQRCVDDTVIAAAFLRERAGRLPLLAFGARLGGSIAMEAAQAAALDGVIAWDPIVDGADHVARLDAMQESLRLDGRRFMKPRVASDAAAQWQGFAIDPRFRRQLAEWRARPCEVPLLRVDSSMAGGGRAMAQPDDRTRVAPLAASPPWDELDRLELAILSHPLIQLVIGHLRELR